MPVKVYGEERIWYCYECMRYFFFDHRTVLLLIFIETNRNLFIGYIAAYIMIYLTVYAFSLLLIWWIKFWMMTCLLSRVENNAQVIYQCITFGLRLLYLNICWHNYAYWVICFDILLFVLLLYYLHILLYLYIYI